MDYEDLYKVLPKDPKKWKFDDVSIWLKFIGLQDLDTNFRQNSIDGSLLSTLDDNDFKEMGIAESQLKIKKLVQWIKIGFKEYSEYLAQVQQFDQNNQIENDQSNNLLVSNQYKKSSIKAVNFDEQQENKSDPIIQTQHQQTFSIEETKIPKQINNKQLKIIKVSEGNKEFIIPKEGSTIGRNLDCNIVLKEDYISRQHCRIAYKEQTDCYFLQDLGSSSGTYIQLVNPTLLKEGLILHMGLGQFLISKIKINNQKCQVYINVLEGQMQNQSLDFELTQDETALIFGRQMKYFTEDSHLSGQHAQFTFQQDGLVIEDLDSRNGTWLRLSAPHKQSEPVKLLNGRRFRLAYEQYFDCQIN